MYWGGCHAPARPYAPVSKPGLLDEGRVPRGVQGRAGAEPQKHLENVCFQLYDPFCYLYCNYLPNNGVIGVSIASLI